MNLLSIDLPVKKIYHSLNLPTVKLPPNMFITDKFADDEFTTQ